MANFLKRIWYSRKARIILVIVIHILAIPFLVFGSMWTVCRPGIAIEGKSPLRSTQKNSSVDVSHFKLREVPNYYRNEEQTYLTFPEWYIVYSADEFAAFNRINSPSHFPYGKSIGQYWQSYCKEYALTRGIYPFNAGYHIVLMVIGTSFTVENTIRGFYENTIGRMTEWVSSGGRSEEDLYANTVATEYGNFIHTIPWYEFPFRKKLKGLWTETELWGSYPIRKWERKIALSLEYGVKAAYGALIKKSTKSAYAPQDLEIYAIVGDVSETIADVPEVTIISRERERTLVSIPRYEAFTQIVKPLLLEQMEFVEIAGNDDVQVTAIADQQWKSSHSGLLLFEMELPTQPKLKRVVLNIPVIELHNVAREFAAENVILEHIYDY